MADQTLKILIDSVFSAKGFEQANKSIGDVDNNTKKLKSSNELLSSSFSSLTGILATVGFATLAKDAIQMADTYKLMSARLSLVTHNTGEFINAQTKLFAMSQETRSSLEYTTQLYTKVSMSVETLGKSQNQILSFTKAVNESMKISGASTQEATATVLQLGQALASGKLQGDEYRSLRENAPRLAKAIADGMGVEVGALKNLATEGKLTAEVVFNAIEKSGAKLDEEFKKIPATVSDSFTTLSNQALKLVGDLDSATGASASLSSSMLDFSKTLNDGTSDIVTFGKFTYATLDRTKDMFMLVGITAKNMVELSIGGIAGTVYGAMSSVADMALYATEKLNSIGLSSDSTLASARTSASSMKKLYRQSVDSINEDWKDIDDAVKKASPTVEDRISQMKRLGVVTNQVSKDTKKSGGAGSEETKEQKAAREKAEKAREAAAKKEAEIQRGYIESYADLQAKDAIEIYNNKITLIEDNAEREAKAAITQHELDLWYIDDLASRQAKYAVDLYDAITPDSAKIITKYTAIFETMKDMPVEMLKSLGDQMNTELDNIKDGFDFGINIEFDPSMMDGMQKGLAGVMKSTQLLGKEEKQYQKNKTLYAKDSIEYAQNEEEHTDSQIAGYSNLAGAASAMFEQGSSEAKAFTIIQSGLAMVNAITGIAAQAALPFPYNIAAMAGTAATVFSFIGATGSGGGAVDPAIAQAETNKTQIEATYAPITDRLDSQISLLTAIELNGSAAQKQTQLAFAQFSRDLKLNAIEVSATASSGMHESDTGSWYGAVARVPSVTRQLASQYGMSGMWASTANGDSDLNYSMRGLVDTQQELLTYIAHRDEIDSLIASIGLINFRTTPTTKLMSDDAFEAAIISIQSIINTFAESSVDAMKDLKNSSLEWQDAFDSITGTTKYEALRLKEAYGLVNNLKGDSSLADFLETQINDIANVLKEFDKSTIDLLMSTDMSKITEQSSEVIRLNSVLATVYEGTAKEAINLTESISLVASAEAELLKIKVTSRDYSRNFKEYTLNDDPLSKATYRLSYMTSDLAALSKQLGASNVSLANFASMYESAVSTNFTPETVDLWQTLGDNLMKVTDAQKAYNDALKTTVNTGFMQDMMLSKVGTSSTTLDIKAMVSQQAVNNTNQSQQIAVLYEIVRTLKEQLYIQQFGTKVGIPA